MDRHEDQRESNGSRILFGLLIMLFGLIMLADTTGLAAFELERRYWPLIVVAFGTLRFLDPPVRHGRRSRRGGAWLIYVGLWGLVSEFHLFGLDYSTSWPLLIVGLGVATIWRAVDPDDPRPVPRENRP